MGQYLVFANQCCGGYLRHHESGVQPGARGEKRRQAFAQRGIDQSLNAPFADAGQSAQGDGEEVEGEGQRLAVEVASGDHIAQRLFGVSNKYERIVDRRIRLDLEYFTTVSKRVAHRSRALRNEREE